MPYSKSAKYTHHRQRKPGLFVKSSFHTISVKRAKVRGLYSGKKFDKPGAKAIVARLRKNGKYAVQSFLLKKK